MAFASFRFPYLFCSCLGACCRRLGLALAAVNLGSLPALAVLVAISYSPMGDASGPLGRADGYPLLGEQIRKRRFLQAADDYWERWS
ncbi:hypothetical protein [Arthrobacter sp. OAP107]|uniref:hypothetical protein n=1 Tax=Arthrobacter sp. OAP107 TaxID=3156445 RepID=UPI003395C092